MTLSIQRTYQPITEKPYCCVPAVLQMIQESRGFGKASQEEIGFELGLIVPPELASLFSKVRVGDEPISGYGTQTSLSEFSIAHYLSKAKLPLDYRIVKHVSFQDFSSCIVEHIKNDDDLVICYNSQEYFGDGDPEHVSLIQAYDSESDVLTIVDPAIGVPKIRTGTAQMLFKVIEAHTISDRAGLWIFSGASSLTK